MATKTRRGQSGPNGPSRPTRVATIEDVERIEAELRAARLDVARDLRARREAAGLSLRDVAPRVELSPGALSQTERGETWQTSTAKRLRRFYEEFGSGQDLPQAA